MMTSTSRSRSRIRSGHSWNAFIRFYVCAEAREFDDKDLQIPKPVLYCTGEKDPYVPHEEIEKDKAFLADRSACDVQVRTFNMGHESCEQELAVCANWLAKVLAVDGDDDALGAAAGVGFIK